MEYDFIIYLLCGAISTNISYNNDTILKTVRAARNSEASPGERVGAAVNYHDALLARCNYGSFSTELARVPELLVSRNRRGWRHHASGARSADI